MPQYRVGQSAVYKKTITEEDVNRFAEITGDINPVHLDEKYAETTPFKGKIAHGFLVGSMISKILGVDFPGPGTIYANQTMSFKAPAYIGDILEARVEVISYDEVKNKMVLGTEIKNHEGKIILTGEAVVFPPK